MRATEKKCTKCMTIKRLNKMDESKERKRERGRKRER